MKRIEISLKEILVYVLRRWKPILAFAVTLAVVVGVYGYIWPNSSRVGSKTKFVDNTNLLTTLSLSIDLIDYNPDYGVTMSAIFSNLGTRYLIVAQGAHLAKILDGIAPRNFSDIDLQNYVKVEIPTPGIINIVVAEADGIDSIKATEAIYGYLRHQTELFYRNVSKHELTILASKSTFLTEDPTSLAAVLVSSEIIALGVGFVLAILGAAAIYIIGLPIQIPQQIQRQLDIRYLGGVRRKRHLSLGDRFAGLLRMDNEEKAMEIIAANVHDFAGDHKRILVTGTVTKELLKVFTQKIAEVHRMSDVLFVHGSDINNNANTIVMLKDNDAVILVERIDESKLKRINEVKERLDMSGKEILGYVLY